MWRVESRSCPHARAGFSGLWPEIGKICKNMGFGLKITPEGFNLECFNLWTLRV